MAELTVNVIHYRKRIVGLKKLRIALQRLLVGALRLLLFIALTVNSGKTVVCVGVTRIRIRMELPSQRTVCLFDLVGRGVARNAQRLIRIGHF